MGLLDTFIQSIQDLNPEWTRERLKTAAGLLADFTPVVGDVKAGYDMVDSARQGNYGEAALNGIGLLPFVPAMGGVMKGMSWEQILAKQRAAEGMRAAMRDPVTGEIYTGSSHRAAIERGVPVGDTSGAYGRLYDEWDRGTDNTGFINKLGEFISRTQAEKEIGVSTMEDLKDLMKSRR